MSFELGGLKYEDLQTHLNQYNLLKRTNFSGQLLWYEYFVGLP